MKNTQYIYTCKGKQRPIAIMSEVIRFGAAGAPAGTVIEMTDDVIPQGEYLPDYSKASWHPVNVLDGYLTGATAIRVVMGDSGCCTLTVESIENQPDFGCVGALTRNNALLATINADMRVATLAALAR